MNKLERNFNNSNETFEEIKHIDENGVEFWYARELMPVISSHKMEIREKRLLPLHKPILPFKRDNIQTEKEACGTHNIVGQIVRNAIKQAGRNNARRTTNPTKKLKTIRKGTKRSE